MYTLKISVYTIFGLLDTYYPVKGHFENMSGNVARSAMLGTGGVACVKNITVATRWAKDLMESYMLETNRRPVAFGPKYDPSEHAPNPQLLPLVFSLVCGVNEQLKEINKLFDGIISSIRGAAENIEFRHHMSADQRENFRNNPPQHGGNNIFPRGSVRVVVEVVEPPVSHSENVLFAI